VNPSVEFEHQSQLSAIEVDDESIDGVLSAELESEQLTISQETPGGPFRRGGTVAERAGSLNETELDWVATDPHGTTLQTAATFGRADPCDQDPLFAFPLSRQGEGVRG
jgi:hypothetical protein